MKKFTSEELLEVLPVTLRETKELTPKQKLVLGQLIIYNGLDKKDADGYFFRSNLELCTDCDIKDEHTLITALRKLVYLGFIERKTGSRRTGASLYKVLEDRIKDYCNTYTGNSSDNSSTDTDKDIEIDRDIKILINKILLITNKEILINILNSVLEEQELVRMAESAKPVSQSVQDSQASALSEDVPQASPVKEQDAPKLGEVQGTPVETEIPAGNDTQGATESPATPVEEEQYQQWLQVVNPYLMEVADSSSISEFRDVKARMIHAVEDYYKDHEDTSPSVLEYIAEKVDSVFNTKNAYLNTQTQRIIEQIEYQSSLFN